MYVTQMIVISLSRVKWQQIELWNQLIIGWINYFKIGNMKQFMEEYGSWLRHKVRVIIIKQWKKPKTIYTNLNKINLKFSNGFNEEEIYKVANSRLGWYKRCSMNVVNFVLNPKVLNIQRKDQIWSILWNITLIVCNKTI